jgi:predicted anti-sigma-YlaC factor YlaD
MTCAQAIAKLAEYLDAELTPALLVELEAHLDVCEPCRAYLSTYRRAKDLATKVSRVTMPDEMRRRLRALLTDHGRGPS